MSQPWAGPDIDLPGLGTSALTDIYLPLSLAIITFGMGLTMRVPDFRRVFAQPRGLLVGLLGQLLLLPLAAMGVVTLLILTTDLDPLLAIGFLLLASCPSGATSNVVTYMARGDAPLAVSFTTINSVTAWITTPSILFATTWLLSGDPSTIHVSFVEVMLLTLMVIGLPVALGMWVGSRRPALAARVDGWVRIGGLLLLAALIGAIIHANRATFWESVRLTVPGALLLNLVAFGIGYGSALVARLGEPQRRTCAIEVGFQNGTLGILLAVSQLNSPQAAIVPGFYGLVMLLTGGMLATYWARRPPAGTPIVAPAPSTEAPTGPQRVS